MDNPIAPPPSPVEVSDPPATAAAKRPRRDHGSGSIHRHSSGKWCGMLSVTLGGVRKRYSVYGDTKPEVREKLKALQEQLAAGPTGINPTEETLSTYLTRWLADTVAPERKYNTLRNYRYTVEKLIAPTLGEVRVVDVTTEHVKHLMAGLARDERSTRARQLAHAVLRKAFNDAVEAEIISASPMRRVKAPRVARKDMRVFTAEEAKRYLEAARGGWYENVFAVALGTGARLGELLGLKWSDVDLPGSAINIQATLIEDGGKIIGRHEVKSTAGRRRVDLAAITVAALRDQRKRLLAAGLAASPWVFPATNGENILQGNIRRAHYVLIENLGLPEIRVHDLRHTHATLLLQAGENVKVVSERLGHSSVKVTLEIYAHVLPSMQRGAAVKIGEVLG